MRSRSVWRQCTPEEIAERVENDPSLAKRDNVLFFTGDSKSRPGRRIREALTKPDGFKPSTEFVYRTP